MATMQIKDLFDSIRDELRKMVRNGHTTERGLARRAGVSQSHVHNVLKGTRLLTPWVADRLLEAMDLSLRDVMVEAGGWPKR